MTKRIYQRAKRSSGFASLARDESLAKELGPRKIRVGQIRTLAPKLNTLPMNRNIQSIPR
jgi:hypothetical protein